MKYKLTDNKKEFSGITLYQIQALKDFSNVKAGDLGGWIESEINLSQNGSAWVCGNAWVYGSAKVSGSAWVSGNAKVYGNAMVSGSAWVYGDARVSENAKVYGNMLTLKGSTYTCNPLPNKDELKINIGCMAFTYNEWIDKGETIAKEENFTEFQIHEYKTYIELIKKWYDEVYLPNYKEEYDDREN